MHMCDYFGGRGSMFNGPVGTNNFRVCQDVGTVQGLEQNKYPHSYAYCTPSSFSPNEHVICTWRDKST